jgi:alkylation response protein AidB-like acyl-CoA dehydrogenase
VSRLDAAVDLADRVLFPAAAAVEASGTVPASHLDLLAAAGLYGLFADPEPAPAYRVVEALASGCLATAFVWMQHHGALRAVGAAPAARDRWYEDMRAGRVRAGTAQGGLRPGPPLLRATGGPDGFVLDGEAPWVTGWSLVDVLLVAARDADDLAHWFLLDATDAPGLTVEPLDLLAVTASRTVHCRFTGYRVPADRLVSSLPFADWRERDAAGLRGNGSLALGVAGRCLRLLADLEPDAAARLESTVDEVRARLDGATPVELPVARAAASGRALRCASTLVVATGARSVLAGEPAQRLLREATFLLVFGSRPAIRADLLRRLAP